MHVYTRAKSPTRVMAVQKASPDGTSYKYIAPLYTQAFDPMFVASVPAPSPSGTNSDCTCGLTQVNDRLPAICVRKDLPEVTPFMSTCVCTRVFARTRATCVVAAFRGGINSRCTSGPTRRRGRIVAVYASSDSPEKILYACTSVPTRAHDLMCALCVVRTLSVLTNFKDINARTLNWCVTIFCVHHRVKVLRTTHLLVPTCGKHFIVSNKITITKTRRKLNPHEDIGKLKRNVKEEIAKYKRNIVMPAKTNMQMIVKVVDKIRQISSYKK